MRRLVAMFSLLLFVSGCQPFSVNTQADPYADFSSYQRFDWLQEKTDKTIEKTLLEQQLKFSLERELQSKGVVRDPQQADFLISFYATQEQKSAERTIENVHYWGGRSRYSLYDYPLPLDTAVDKWRYPPERRNNVTRSSETVTVDYKKGSLVIDFVDAETKQLIWQATVQGVVDERDPVGQLDKAVLKALEQFPPQP